MTHVLLHNLILGFSVAFSPTNLLYAFVGCGLGTFISVLPGLGPLATIALLLPITYSLGPIPALIMLSGIYYGAQHGDAITAVMINLPGDASSAVICLDGYQMSKQGRAGAALAISAISSFFAGTVGTLIIALFGPPLATVALKFGATENFSLMALGLVLAVSLSRGSVIKAMGMVLLGVLFGLVGTDVNSGLTRFTLGVPNLAEGLDIVGVTLGLFGIAEIIANLQSKDRRDVLPSKIKWITLTREDIRASWKPVLRGTVLGAVYGLIPGTHALIASFSSYILERKVSRHPEKFGTGMIEGVAGPEAAKSAAAQTYFIPMLTLGIPTGAVMSVLLGAMVIQGIAPGPQVMTKNPDLFWGLIASMWIGNLMLLVLNLPLVGIWVKMLATPFRFLFPTILVFACIGCYSTTSTSLNVYVCALFGLLGYILLKLDCRPAPLLLGFVLGPMMEENLRRSLLIDRGDLAILVTQPISAAFLAVAALAALAIIVPAILRLVRQKGAPAPQH